MPERRNISESIEVLIKKYNSKSEKDLKEMSEANVRIGFIDELFGILGWKTNDSDEYDAESYVKGIGFADVVLKHEGKPKIFIEAKRFGGVPSRQERSVQTTLNGLKIYADWTSEERQVLNYAGATVGAKWAILTNFEKFRLFNAKTGEIVLNIEKPSEFLERIDDILLLTAENVKNNNINKLEDRVERPDVDMHFLTLIKKWKIILADEIYKNNSNLSLNQINLYVQRILDRLVIIRYAEDNWILDSPDQLMAVLNSANKADYISLTDMLINFFNGFDKAHNSKIFEKDERINEIILTLSDKSLADLINDLYNQSFRKFTSDILGNTYESYLGSKLVLTENELSLEDERRTTKDQGIYYTPTYIVEYIVQNTLGKKLEAIWTEVMVCFNSNEYENAVLKFKEIYDIKVLDPSCGSGSFLIKAHDLFVRYYSKYAEQVQKAENDLKNEIINENLNSWEFEKLKNIINEPLKNFEKRILKKNIYGVDIDENAAEIASVNLMLRALKPREKLPLILYENIKVGNSVITGVEDMDELKNHSDNIKELIIHRREIKLATNLQEKAKLEKEHSILKDSINEKINSNLHDFFNNFNNLNPFNWEIEFPEVFYDKNGELKENGGFDVVIGNPPYIRVDTLKKEDKKYWKKYFESSVGKYDIYYLFIESLFKWLKKDGDCGFIVPNRFCAASSGKKLRNLLINNSQYLSIISVSNLTVFKTASNYPLILLLKKGDNLQKISINSAITKNDFFNQDFINYELAFDDLDFLPDNIIPININQLQLDLVIKLIKNNEKLSDYLKISEGLRIPQKYERESPEKFEILKQFQFDRYSDINKGSYISENDLSEVINFTSERYLNILKEKIVIAEDALRVSASWDDKSRIPQGGVYFGVLKNEILPIKYLMVLLNSKLLSFVYNVLFGGMHMGGGYLRYRSEFLGQLPIKTVDNNLQKIFNDGFMQILLLNKQKKTIIEAFNALIINSNQNKEYKSLKHYLDLNNAPDYSINLVKSEELIRKDQKGIIRKYSVSEEENYLILSVKYMNQDKNDVLKIYFDDDILRTFFYFAIHSSIDGKTKAYRSDKDILNTLLNDIKVPQSFRNKEKDIQNIKLLMDVLKLEYGKMLNETFDKSLVQELSIDKISKKIHEIEEEIDTTIYEVYGLTNTEIKIVEDNFE